MGLVVKLIDAVLFVFFLKMAIGVPLFEAQLVAPLKYFPESVVELKDRYGSEYGDYLFVERPHFFIGLVWLKLLLVWPLSIFNLVGLFSRRYWFRTTCVIFGAATLTAKAAIIGELLGSGRASEKLLKIYYAFMGLAALAFLRGLICTTSGGIGRRPAVLARKKRA